MSAEASGLLAHWKLDESAGTSAEDSAGSNTGTLSNGPVWQSAGGVTKGALDFDGADDLVGAGSAAAVDDIAALTISAWIYPRTAGELSNAWIIGKATGTNIATSGWLFSLSNDETRTIKFSVEYSSSHIEHTGVANVITLNAWNHVVVTWNGTTAAGNNHIYVNNAEISYGYTDNGSGSRVSDAASNISIGNNPATSRTFDGLIDDVRIYNRVLSGTEISDLYKAGGTGC